MLDISDRKNCFYWQTDRNLRVEDYEKYFLKRHNLPASDIKRVLKNGIRSIKNIGDIEIIEADESILKGNVNIVRKVRVNGDLYLARLHPAGVKNGYFYVEKTALELAGKGGIPCPVPIEIHQAENEQDMDFIITTVSPGVTMELAIKQNPSIESKLLRQAGSIMANIHNIEVENYGSFDNEIAESENRLSGLHASYGEFIFCGLEENIRRLLSFSIINKRQSKKFSDIFAEYIFEPIGNVKLIHNDFADWNILADQDSISAVLDWDECHGGDPIADLACWSTFYNIERMKDFMNGYVSIANLPDDFEPRFHYYRLRYTLSKMALRVKRAQVDDSQFIKDKIAVGKKALMEEINWFSDYQK